MDKKWLVYQNGKISGPWSATEIREQLREGRIDPFDFVSKEGSNVRLKMIEADELFEPLSRSSSGTSGLAGEISSHGNTKISELPDLPPSPPQENPLLLNKAASALGAAQPGALPPPFIPKVRGPIIAGKKKSSSPLDHWYWPSLGVLFLLILATAFLVFSSEANSKKPQKPKLKGFFQSTP